VILGSRKVQVDKMGVFYFRQNEATENGINTFTVSSQADIHIFLFIAIIL